MVKTVPVFYVLEPCHKLVEVFRRLRKKMIYHIKIVVKPTPFILYYFYLSFEQLIFIELIE